MNIELKPIAESKVRQLGGDVCGVLVRKDGRLAAVDEHGRVMWLDSWGEADRAQGGQGAEVVAWECSGKPGLYDNITRSKGEADHHRKIGRTVRPLVYGDTKPESDQGGRGAEAVAWASPLPDGTEQVTKELPERIYGVVPKDYQWYVCPLVYADTQPQPAVPEGWRECLQEMVQAMYDYEMSVEEDAPYKHRAMMDRAHALLSTPTTPQADGWVSMADRHPTKSDEDCEGKIWLLWPNRRYFERVLRGSVLCSPEFCWMPTGLKRPQRPAGQEGDEAERAGGEK